MKKPQNEKRVINVPKADFDLIKKHCEANSLDMVSWMVKNTTEKLTKKIPEYRITAKEAREIFQDSRLMELPEDWLDRVLKEIDECIKWGVSGGTNKSYVRCGGTLESTNKYGHSCELSLSEHQLEIVKTELSRMGFFLQKQSDGGGLAKLSYIVGW
jgi:hypothetical protein